VHLENGVANVTGAGSGIGRATAIGLAESAAVPVADVDGEAAGHVALLRRVARAIRFDYPERSVRLEKETLNDTANR
jgi:NAD(P)-dependent dehydrogenase (short-subunit alcohol dehydrogenase family)